MKTFKDLVFKPHPMGDGIIAREQFENGFEDFLNSFDSSGFVTEQGDIEDWHVKALDKQKIRETVLKNLQEARVELNK